MLPMRLTYISPPTASVKKWLIAFYNAFSPRHGMSCDETVFLVGTGIKNLKLHKTQQVDCFMTLWLSVRHVSSSFADIRVLLAAGLFFEAGTKLYKLISMGLG